MEQTYSFSNKQFLQNVQDFFAKTMDIALITVADQKHMTKLSNLRNFCKNIHKNSKIGYQRCLNCHAKVEQEAAATKKPVITKCHSGLTLFAIPIIHESKYIASVVGGQISDEEINYKKILELSQELRIDENECIKYAGEIKILPKNHIETIVDSLFRIANSVISIAYAHSKLSKAGLNYSFHKSKALEEWLFLNFKKIKVPLSDREFEVLKLIVLGKSNTEIANELFISMHTAKAHVSSILEKFGAEDRVQVAVKAVREGLI